VNSKFKIQNSKLIQSKRFVDFEWSVYLRRAVLGSRVVIAQRIWFLLGSAFANCKSVFIPI
jgi:hypothetical protein